MALAALLLLASGIQAQAPPDAGKSAAGDERVQLDFNDVDLPVVIDTIARMTGKNFIYDDRVRGRVTIVSPAPISVDEAYAVFESVLQVKGFTTVRGPGGALKVIPIRDAKESNVELLEGEARTPRSDRFVTRLIPLEFIDADAITNTLRPLVSKDASMVAYAPTNTVILTDSATNISRILRILRSIDVETYKQELSVIKIRNADAGTLADQLSQIFDADIASRRAPTPVARVRRAVQPASAGPAASRGKIRILTDERTNSLVILAPRQRMADLRKAIQRLDVPVSGGGRIHVYYLKNADAEELTNTLNSLISGQPRGAAAPRGRGAAGRAGAQALRAAITELAEGVTVTADPPTNSLVIQASQQGYETILKVIDQLDIARPQVLVEALIMEVDVTDNRDLGFSGLVRLTTDGNSFALGSLTSGSSALSRFLGSDNGGSNPPAAPQPSNNAISSAVLNALLAGLTGTPPGFLSATSVSAGSTLIQGIIRASSSLKGANIISAPHVLTMDNEEAEIKVGDNIPIPTSRVSSAQGVVGSNALASSVNIERQDIGVTLRVTPQITEGENLRLKIFQEIKNVNQALTLVTGNPADVGVSLSNRTVENTVVVQDDETVVIGGLISDDYEDTVTKVPWLGDIPILGWLFKTTSRNLTKTNLLIFLTPHIVRTSDELELATLHKRQEFWDHSEEGISLNEQERAEQERRRKAAGKSKAESEAIKSRNPVRRRLLEMERRAPLDRMLELERRHEERKKEESDKTGAAPIPQPRYGVLAGTFGDPDAAAATLQELIDAGYDGTLVSGDSGGTILYQVQLGPFEDQTAAAHAAQALREGFDLRATVTV